MLVTSLEALSKNGVASYLTFLQTENDPRCYEYKDDDEGCQNKYQYFDVYVSGKETWRSICALFTTWGTSGTCVLKQ